MEQDVPSEQTFYVYDGSTLLGEVAAGSLEPTPVAKAAYTWGADGLVSERLLNQSGAADMSLWYHFGPQG